MHIVFKVNYFWVTKNKFILCLAMLIKSLIIKTVIQDRYILTYKKKRHYKK